MVIIFQFYHFVIIIDHYNNTLQEQSYYQYMSLLQEYVSSGPNISQEIKDDLFSLPVEISLLVTAVLSSVISLLIPALYYIRKTCREHPSSLMAIISLLEALSNYNIILIAFNIYQFEHFVHIEKIFDILIFYTQEPSQTNFCEFNFTLYIILELMSIAYNIAFSTDLLVTLKTPFFAGKKRMKFYHAFAFLFVAVSLPMSIVQAVDICDDEFHTKSIYKIPKAFILSIIVFYIISFAIIIMSFFSVQNSQIRKKYIRLHRIILFTLIIIWAFPLATNIFIVLGDQQSDLFHIFNLLSFFSLLLSGGLINVVRFYNDPYLWLQIKKMIFECKCTIKQKKHESEDQESKVEDNMDIWNLPLAHAVSTFHHQSVISNIIEIVLETCTNTIQQRAIYTSDYSRQPQHYYFGSTVMGIRQIKNFLKIGNKQEIKRLTKITKSLQMLCLQRKSGFTNKNSPNKNIYKASDFAATYNSSPRINDSATSGTKSDQLNNRQYIINSLKPPQNETIVIKVKSYADPVFLALRLIDGITSQQLNRTLNLIENADNIKKARESLGASGSFFFFSFDNRLVIKTISEKQSQIFLKILPEFYQHIINNPNSLISRAYGLFSVEIAGISKIHFIMMQNTLRIFQENNVAYKKYDLKGSTIKRQVKNVNAAVFKDINFLKGDDAFLIMTAQRKKLLLDQISADVTLLMKQNIMDYSILLGIGYHKKISYERKITEQEMGVERNQWRCFDDGHEITGKIYSISLIDYLQDFDWNKYMELKLKKIFKGGGDISSVDAKSYYNRFLLFVSRIIVVFKK